MQHWLTTTTNRNGFVRNYLLKFIRPYTNQSEEKFYKVTSFSEGATAHSKTIKGDILDHAVDLKSIRPGESISVPYEITIANSFRDFWQSAFYSHDRINTSTPFARSLGFQDQVIPFNLMLFLAGSMSHADHAKLQVGFKNARYHWPAFAGDTFKKQFIIQSLRTTSDQMNSIIKIHCQLINQKNTVVFSCDKSMMFPFVVPPSDVQMTDYPELKRNDFLDHLVQKSETLQSLGSQTLSSVKPGQLILHTLTRPISETHTMQLATLARLTHERHFNTRLFKREELLVPGGLVLALASSVASRDLHENLFEQLLECSFPNNFSPGDVMGAVTFIRELEEHISGDIQAITVRTIGIKNLDVHRALANRNIPIDLLTLPLKALKPSLIEDLVKRTIPELTKLVVCIADRKIYRQAPKHTPFLL